MSLSSASTKPVVPDDARCKSCGYPLRAIDSTRCPECGRDFDPADFRTMHVGRSVGRVGRFLLRPTGAAPVALCVIAAAALVCISRLPGSRPHVSTGEFEYYFRVGGFRDRISTATDVMFVASVVLLVGVAVYLVARFLARVIVSRHYHLPMERPVNPGRRAVLLAFAGIVATTAAAIGWPRRIAKIWARLWGEQLAARQASSVYLTANGAPPVMLSPTELEAVLQSGVIQLPSVKERITALHLLMSEYHRFAPQILVHAIALEKDVELRAIEIRLLGLFRDATFLPNLLPLMDDPDVAIRAAAIDAVGIVYAPAFPILNKVYTSRVELALDSDPPIPLSAFTVSPYGGSIDTSPRGKLPPALKDKLWRIISTAATTEEREAAARAVYRWQNSPKFRVAEWGVWIAGNGEHFQLSKAILEEIPPFVHQTGDKVEDDPSYLSEPDEITKPIIHITTDMALVLDFAVVINSGRPWYVYPLPDDYTVSSGRADPEFAKLQNASLKKLPEPRRGYKWTLPPHDTAPSRAGWGQMFVDSIGVRWQSLIVSPERFAWMNPPSVPNDARYRWWTRLRDVPSAWVSSCGEADRFLYYDGPTTFPSKWTVKIEDGRLTFKYVSVSDFASSAYWQMKTNRFVDETSDERSERGIFIEVGQTGKVTGSVVTFSGSPFRELTKNMEIARLNDLEGAAVPAGLLTLLKTAGLTTDEASGLIDSWREQFFQTPGRRFVRIMLPKEYDNICPIQIDPPPTELVRVGLVLTEFGRD